jgi:hypothetical protein
VISETIAVLAPQILPPPHRLSFFRNIVQM